MRSGTAILWFETHILAIILIVHFVNAFFYIWLISIFLSSRQLLMNRVVNKSLLYRSEFQTGKTKVHYLFRMPGQVPSRAFCCCFDPNQCHSLPYILISFHDKGYSVMRKWRPRKFQKIFMEFCEFQIRACVSFNANVQLCRANMRLYIKYTHTINCDNYLFWETVIAVKRKSKESL